MAIYSLKKIKEERRQRIISEFNPAPRGRMEEYARLAKKYKVSVPLVILYIKSANRLGFSHNTISKNAE